MANGFYIQLPANQTPIAKPSARGPPLTPASVSPPSLTAHNSCAARHDAGATPAKATAMLTRMASYSSSRTRNSASSPPQSPVEDRQSMHTDASEYWYSERKEGGYISFPDFEKYCQSTTSSERSDSHSEYHEDRT